MATKWGVHFNQHWVSAELNPFQNYDRDQALMYPLLADAGGTVGRYHGLWSDYQTQPTLAFDVDSYQLSNANYQKYLEGRGYGVDGALLDVPFQSLKIGSDLKVQTLFNLGGIPEWAQTGPGTLVLRDTASVGEFISDFMVYAARQPEGLGVLSSLTGMQIFNEVNGGARPFQPGYGYRADQLPHQQYFEIVDHTMHLVQQSFSRIGWSEKTNNAPPPNIIAPNLGGAFTPGFWDALSKYVPLHKASRSVAGQLTLNSVALHPSGVSVRPDVDPKLSDTSPTPNIDSWALHDTLTYRRYMMPTDDRVWIENLVARDPTRSAQWSLATYAPRGNPADEYFDRNTEMGIERSMAKLTQIGQRSVKIHLSEFGATSFAGGTSFEGGDGKESLWDTVFADPYKYPFVAMDGRMTKAVAENLQAESLMQAVGLIDSWDFVETATAYQFFDYEGLGAERQFGLAAQTVKRDGTPDFKPAGLAYEAFMQGREIHLVNTATTAKNSGVDIHIAAATGAFSNAKRRSDAHELILMRDGPNRLNAGDGDDIVFGGPGENHISGGRGFDKIYGGPGNDVIDGGPDDDRIKGDAGDDVMTGGPGNNHFVFAAYGMGTSGNHGRDVITDFKPGSLNPKQHDQLTIIGGYGATALLDQTITATLIQDAPGGVIIFYADNGASLQLRDVTKAQLSVKDFRIFDPDVTVDFVPDLVAPF